MNSIESGKIYFGQVIEAIPPTDQRNFYKHQYIYSVSIKLDLFSTVNYFCVKADSYGSKVNFKDEVLDVGAKVFVSFLVEDLNFGIIMGSSRFFPTPTDTALGRHLKDRFNNIETFISKDNNYSVTSLIGGTNLQINTGSIVLDDASNDKITIDKANKKITIECQTWNVEVKGNATINVGGSANITANDVNVTAKGSTKLKSSGSTTVTASNITLNGSSGAVLTDTLNPVVDLITGVPSVGVKNVKSG